MRFTATICNLMLFGFTCLVLLTEGISGSAFYIVLTIMLLAVPVLNLIMIIPGKEGHGWFSFRMKRKTREERGTNDPSFLLNTIMKFAVVFCNAALFVFSCWSFLSQYPHPKEQGFILYTLLVLLTPVCSIFAILQSIEKINPVSRIQASSE